LGGEEVGSQDCMRGGMLGLVVVREGGPSWICRDWYELRLEVEVMKVSTITEVLGGWHEIVRLG
jgi:hypothetical protein